jgi:hypothetical protein
MYCNIPSEIRIGHHKAEIMQETEEYIYSDLYKITQSGFTPLSFKNL